MADDSASSAPISKTHLSSIQDLLQHWSTRGIPLDRALLRRINRSNASVVARLIHGICRYDRQIASPSWYIAALDKDSPRETLHTILLANLGGKITGDAIRFAKDGTLDTSSEYLQKYDQALPGIRASYEWWDDLTSNRFGWKSLLALSDAIDGRTGRIHPSFTTETATGRVSVSNPPIHSLSLKEPAELEGTELFILRAKGVFKPLADDHFLMVVDVKQAETTLQAFLSGDPALQEAVQNDYHATLAATYWPEAWEAASEDRKRVLRERAKGPNHALSYGSGPDGLARSTGLALEDAQRIHRSYWEQFAVLDAYRRQAAQEAKQRGHILTLGGNHLPLIGVSGGIKPDYKIFQHFIQGSYADVINTTCLHLHNRLRGLKSDLLFHWHDALFLSVKESEADAVVPMVLDALRNPTVGQGHGLQPRFNVEWDRRSNDEAVAAPDDAFFCTKRPALYRGPREFNLFGHKFLGEDYDDVP